MARILVSYEEQHHRNQPITNCKFIKSDLDLWPSWPKFLHNMLCWCDKHSYQVWWKSLEANRIYAVDTNLIQYSDPLSWIVTLTFDLANQRLYTAHRLGTMNIHTKFEENPLKQTEHMPWTQTWFNIETKNLFELDSDLDLWPSWSKVVHCTLPWCNEYSYQVWWKSLKANRSYAPDTKLIQY